MAFKKIGDWDKVERLVHALRPEMVAAKNESLARWGLKAEGLAKKHISSQDLGWKPLAASTISSKVRRGYSENILVMTSTYFQSITSWADKGANTVYAGVKKEARSADGEQLWNIARIQEYGSYSGKIPARPLWQPVFAETMEWHMRMNRPEILFAKRIAKYT